MRRVEGVGIGLRRELVAQAFATTRRIDWVEIVAENYAGERGAARDTLARARDRWPVIPHGVSLSVGSGPPAGYVDEWAELVDFLDPPFASDHLCYASTREHAWLDLLPLPFVEEAVAVAAANARAAAARIGRPLLLENITYYATMPGSMMSERAFVGAVLRAAGPEVGLLLDLNNLFVNATNHGEDPFDALAELPLVAVRQVHLAGYSVEADLLLDTHAAPVAQPVWDLYRELVRAIGPVPTLVEWDQRIPSLDVVLDEVDHAREILEAAS